MVKLPDVSNVLHPSFMRETPSWVYPLIGIYYCSKHRFLFPLLKSRLIPCCLLSVFVLFNLFFWTYLIQVAFLLPFHGAGAWLNATFLVLSEGALITALLFEAFLVDETMVNIFDAILINEGFEDLVAQRRLVNPPHGPSSNMSDAPELTPVQRLGKPERGAVYAPFSLRQILEFILFLPFNFIPWVGTLIFLVMTGYRAGPIHHHRYFAFLGLDKKAKKAVIRRRQLSYTWFGTIGLILQLVPGMSMLFLMTTSAGSALWCARLESARREMLNRAGGGQDNAGRAQAESTPGQPYSDDVV